MKSPKKIAKRRHIRFTAEEKAVAEISLSDRKRPFVPDFLALVFNESYDGCGLVMLSSDALQPGTQCMVKVGKLSPLRAKVAWRTQLDPQAIKLGLDYLE